MYGVSETEHSKAIVVEDNMGLSASKVRRQDCAPTQNAVQFPSTTDHEGNIVPQPVKEI